MFDLDFKSLFMWTVLGIAVGGGVYGAYVKFFGKTAKTQGEAYTLLIECTTLLRSYSATDINEFINKYRLKESNIEKSDAVMTGLNAVIDHNSPPKATGMGVSLSMCIKNLEGRLSEI
ncbi:hypothetical protein [Alteromonas stellipolaris]|uniref:hypothetical protein n=1 Tax=Alteromonas stellipolaris TaxID=233316 RepID=UPI0027342617|nr:hypothetical protein [Alteromonas stellipolaris]MDP2596011.1 hypothetical protein [Alteromonas stellipolaris]